VHLIPSLNISHPYLITFHDFGDNSQEGMKSQMRGATPASEGMTLRIIYFQGFYRALNLFQKQLPGSNSMHLTVHFLVTLIKTPHHLVPQLLPMIASFTKDISGLHK